MNGDKLKAGGWEIDLDGVLSDVSLGNERASWSGPIVLARDGVRLEGRWIGEEGRAEGRVEDLDLLEDGSEALTTVELSDLDGAIAEYLGEPEAFNDGTAAE